MIKHQMSSNNMVIKQELDLKRKEKLSLLPKKDKLQKKIFSTKNRTKQIHLANDTMRVDIHRIKLAIKNQK
jgi:hypothetical protein